jgi:DNA-binding IclR family transcriptional regulator
MAEDELQRQELDRFILDEVDSVPHLEALLLLWNNKPKHWAVEEMAKALYISQEATHSILQDLRQRGFAQSDNDHYSYDPGYDREHLIQKLDRTYRREIIRISNMIHSKASPSVREFARAFKFKRD